MNRLLDDKLHSHGRGEVKRAISTRDEFFNKVSVECRTDDVLESTAPDERFNIGKRSGTQIVEHEHSIAAPQKRFGQMRSDETSAACDEGIHEFEQSRAS